MLSRNQRAIQGALSFPIRVYQAQISRVVEEPLIISAEINEKNMGDFKEDSFEQDAVVAEEFSDMDCMPPDPSLRK